MVYNTQYDQWFSSNNPANDIIYSHKLLPLGATRKLSFNASGLSVILGFAILGGAISHMGV